MISKVTQGSVAYEFCCGGVSCKRLYPVRFTYFTAYFVSSDWQYCHQTAFLFVSFYRPLYCGYTHRVRAHIDSQWRFYKYIFVDGGRWSRQSFVRREIIDRLVTAQMRLRDVAWACDWWLMAGTYMHGHIAGVRWRHTPAAADAATAFTREYGGAGLLLWPQVLSLIGGRWPDNCIAATDNKILDLAFFYSFCFLRSS